MHTYLKADGIYTVGIYHPRCDAGGVWWDWIGLKDFSREYEAAAYACFLNGGCDATPLQAARFTELRAMHLEPAEDEEATA